MSKADSSVASVCNKIICYAIVIEEVAPIISLSLLSTQPLFSEMIIRILNQTIDRSCKPKEQPNIFDTNSKKKKKTLTES